MTMTDAQLRDNPVLSPWLVDSADFPPGATMAEIIEFCLRYAVLAPSGHNAQPWWFAVDGSSVVVGLDPSRGLAVVDPDDREATISVGAAVFYLRTALAHFGFAAKVTLWPDPHDPEACAQLDVSDRGGTDPELEPLFASMTRRHTSRGKFLEQKPSSAILNGLIDDAQAEGAHLCVLTDYPSRHALAELISAADRRQMDDKSFRRELASWLRSGYTHRTDGIRWGGHNVTEVMSLAAPLVVRTFDLGEGRAARDVELATGSPALAVLVTEADDRTSWLTAGQALARVALRATAANLLIGFLDQPVEVPELREAVVEAIGGGAYPQLILRLGYGDAALPQPRRPVDDCLVRR